MSILIKSAKIIDASSKFNGKTKDIFIKQGIIQEINDKIVKKSIDKIHKNILRAKDLKVKYVSFHAGFLFDIIDKKISNSYNDHEYAMNLFKKNILSCCK